MLVTHRFASMENPVAQCATSQAVSEERAEDYHAKDNRSIGAQCFVILSASGGSL